MTNPDEYDLLILGSGEAGMYLTGALAAQGRWVAVVERGYVGGGVPQFRLAASTMGFGSSWRTFRWNDGPDNGRQNFLVWKALGLRSVGFRQIQRLSHCDPYGVEMAGRLRPVLKLAADEES